MKGYHYIGLDVHKKTISYCVKEADGMILEEGRINATRTDLAQFADRMPRPCVIGLEATLFTGWIYDFLRPRADEIKVGHSYMLKAICAGKKKNDRVDAQKVSDALRCNWFPQSYMPEPQVRHLRTTLRYRNMLVREEVRMKNKTAGLLMQAGAEYNKKRLHGKKYFADLMNDLDYIPETVKALARQSHESAQYFHQAQAQLAKALATNPLLARRIDRLQSIPGVGQITALTWALEIDDPHRFKNAKQAMSYCGLCSAQIESGGKTRRAPLSKQRNKYLQSTIIEAAHLAKIHNPQLDAVYEKTLAKRSNKNEAAIETARKLVKYLMYVDKTGKRFQLKENPN